jgi:luciferase-like monooxygenase
VALPLRPGPRPTTTSTNPHTQLDQQPTDPTLSSRLAARVFVLSGVRERESAISVPGARALWLDESLPSGPPEAFLIGREFAHLHPGADHSMHAMLPPDLADEAVKAGWAEQHPVARRGLIPANAVMLYAPRDDDELDVVTSLAEASYSFASTAQPPATPDLRGPHQG